MKFDGYLLTESENTEFYETASALGVICSDGLGKRCGDIVYKYKDTDIAKIKSTFEECRKLAGTGSYDWSSQGVRYIKSIDSDNSEDVLDVFALLTGMYEFRKTIVESVISGKLFFIHNRIEEYYDIEKEVLGEIHGAKKNTTDLVISNANVNKLFDAFRKGPVEIDDAEQYTFVADGVKLFQCSLKKGEDKAQLGKITNFLKKNLNYGVATSQAAQMLAVDSDNIDYNELLMLSEMFWWTKSKTFAKNLWNAVTSSIKKITGKFINKWKSLLNKPPPKQYLKDFFVGAVDPQLQESKMTAKTESRYKAIAANPSKAIQLINSEIKKLENKVIGDETIYYKGSMMKPIKKFKGDMKKGAFTLVSNYCTMRALNDMVSDSKEMSTTVNRLVAEMLFGGTKLPLWKVYGDYGDGHTHSFLGTIGGFVEKAKGNTEVEILGIQIKPTNDFYIIYTAMLDDMDQTGKEYILLRTGTNSSSSFTFIFEGTKTMHVPLEKKLGSAMPKS